MLECVRVSFCVNIYTCLRNLRITQTHVDLCRCRFNLFTCLHGMPRANGSSNIPKRFTMLLGGNRKLCQIYLRAHAGMGFGQRRIFRKWRESSTVVPSKERGAILSVARVCEWCRDKKHHHNHIIRNVSLVLHL